MKKRARRADALFFSQTIRVHPWLSVALSFWLNHRRLRLRALELILGIFGLQRVEHLCRFGSIAGLCPRLVSLFERERRELRVIHDHRDALENFRRVLEAAL